MIRHISIEEIQTVEQAERETRLALLRKKSIEHQMKSMNPDNNDFLLKFQDLETLLDWLKRLYVRRAQLAAEQFQSAKLQEKLS